MNKLQELRLRKEVQERVLMNDGDVLSRSTGSESSQIKIKNGIMIV